jgi:hypothetical protein
MWLKEEVMSNLKVDAMCSSETSVDFHIGLCGAISQKTALLMWVTIGKEKSNSIHIIKSYVIPNLSDQKLIQATSSPMRNIRSST